MKLAWLFDLRAHESVQPHVFAYQARPEYNPARSEPLAQSNGHEQCRESMRFIAVVWDLTGLSLQVDQ